MCINETRSHLKITYFTLRLIFFCVLALKMEGKKLGSKGGRDQSIQFCDRLFDFMFRFLAVFRGKFTSSVCCHVRQLERRKDCPSQQRLVVS